MSINGNRILFDPINGFENPRRAKVISALLVKKEKSSIAGGGVGMSSLMAIQTSDWEIAPMDFQVDNMQTLSVSISFNNQNFKGSTVIKSPGTFVISGLQLNKYFANTSMLISPIHLTFEPVTPVKVRTSDIFFSKG